MAKKQLSDKTDIDVLAEMLGLPSWSTVEGMNEQYFAEAGSTAYRQALDEGESEEDAQEASFDAETEANTDLWKKWYDAVQRAADELFGQHNLELDPITGRRKNPRPFEFRIVPTSAGKNGWDVAANKIRETINGVGMFHFNNLREFLESGPYTARQAVLTHLSYIKRYPDVYGTTSAHRLYEIGFKD
jgi:hypothetical protein